MRRKNVKKKKKKKKKIKKGWGAFPEWGYAKNMYLKKKVYILFLLLSIIFNIIMSWL